MIRLGPITILRTSTKDAYSDVVRAAWILEEAVWYGGEGHDYSALMKATTDLAVALSYVPVEDAPGGSE